MMIVIQHLDVGGSATGRAPVETNAVASKHVHRQRETIHDTSVAQRRRPHRREQGKFSLGEEQESAHEPAPL